ncbi:MAG: hypothetical protein QOD38_1288, partial [Acidimicrobiaceae bacterium]
ALATQLREALTKRVDAEQAAWVAELTAALDEGRVVRALRLSSRPPKAGVILDPALTTRLAEGASASLTADAPAERWAAVLDATAFSPVRLAVKPQSLPEKPSDELLAGAKKLASRLPQVAAAFGIDVSDAPKRRGSSKGKPVPPPPPRIPPPPPLSAPVVEQREPIEPVDAPPSVAVEEQIEQVEGPSEDTVAGDG